MIARRAALPLVAVLLAAPVAAEVVAGAAPRIDSGQEGCFVYERYVVTTAADLARDERVVRIARPLRAGATAARGCPAGAPVVERRYGAGDTFAGMAGDVLLVRQAGSANGGVLLLERIAGKPGKAAVPYTGGEPRVADGAVQLLVPIEDAAAACGAELFVGAVGRAECDARARAWWSCWRRAAPRLAASPDPFAPGAFTGPGKGTDCQVRLAEEARVRLADLSVRKDGRVHAAVSFVATE